METIYHNMANTTYPKELINRKKLIIHNGIYVLAYKSKEKYRFLGIQEGEGNLADLTYEVTGLNINIDNIKELISIKSSYVVCKDINTKLEKVEREITRDYYTYYQSFDKKFIDNLITHGNEWYEEPVILRMDSIKYLNSKRYNKLRLPIKYMEDKERKILC